MEYSLNNLRGRLSRALSVLLRTRINYFTTSHHINKHPYMIKNRKQRGKYFAALSYFVNKYTSDGEFAKVRLSRYRALLMGDEAEEVYSEMDCEKAVRAIINAGLPWQRKHKRFLLFCDVALILMDETSINYVSSEMKKSLSKRQSLLLDDLLDLLHDDKDVPANLSIVDELITQFRANRRFTELPEKRFLITATVSAGKSTLINALVGKCVAKMTQAPCTANLCHVYSKPFEDHTLHHMSAEFGLKLTDNCLAGVAHPSVSYVASYFQTLVPSRKRVCFIDTPGVNHAMELSHGRITRSALNNEQFDKLVYVLSANKLATDEEIIHLKHIHDNVPEDKVIFVLNKLDIFNKKEDSIAMSIEGVKNDLLNIGYNNPVIHPISAYFSLLIKKRRNGEALTEDEQDSYELYAKKFSKAEYDLSQYYECTISGDDDETIIMSKKCGLYGLENILFGGMD